MPAADLPQEIVVRAADFLVIQQVFSQPSPAGSHRLRSLRAAALQLENGCRDRPARPCRRPGRTRAGASAWPASPMSVTITGTPHAMYSANFVGNATSSAGWLILGMISAVGAAQVIDQRRVRYEVHELDVVVFALQGLACGRSSPITRNRTSSSFSSRAASSSSPMPCHFWNRPA